MMKMILGWSAASADGRLKKTARMITIQVLFTVVALVAQGEGRRGWPISTLPDREIVQLNIVRDVRAFGNRAAVASGSLIAIQ